MEFNLNAKQAQLPVGSQAEAPRPARPDPARVYDILIIGGGPAGLNGALYASRKGLDVLVIAEKLGGQMLDTADVDNYLGVEHANAFDLAMQFVGHVRSLGVPVLEGYRAESWEEKDRIHRIKVSGGDVYQGRKVLLATGAKSRTLNVPGEADWTAQGVSYCAICDGPFFRNKKVVIVGGGNSALEGAVDLARTSAEVVVAQRSTYRADPPLLERARALDNVTLYDQTPVVSIVGSDKLDGIEVYDKRTDEKRVIETDGVFVEIGLDPVLGPFAGKLDVNANGEVVISEAFETSLPGVYAAGDLTTVVDKQIIVAAAAGASAALAITRQLNREQS